MGLGVFLFIVAVIASASLEYQIDLNCLNKNYEEWEKNRRRLTAISVFDVRARSALVAWAEDGSGKYLSKSSGRNRPSMSSPGTS